MKGVKMAQQVTDADFQKEVLEANIPVLVDFWAEWCGPCKMVAPILDELSTELAGKVKIVKLNVDENRTTMMKYSVRSIPTMILFKNGEPVDMKVGAAPKASLSQWLEGHAA